MVITFFTANPKTITRSLHHIIEDEDYEMVFFSAKYIITLSDRKYHIIKRYGIKNGEEMFVCFSDDLREFYEEYSKIEFNDEVAYEKVLNIIGEYPKLALDVADVLYKSL